MGTGYTRNDTPNNIADGNVINASDLDGEFDAIQSAFNASTGHSHDGTAGEGPQIDTGGIANDAVTLGTKTSGNYVATGAVSGVGLSGSASAEGATFTITSNATSANTGSTIVARDASGNFSAGTITASLTGTASNAALLDSIDSTSFLRSDAADTKTSGDLSFSDNVKAIFGAGSDLQIYHNATHSYIDNNTGNIYIRSNVDDDDGGNIVLEAKAGESGIIIADDGDVSLHFNGNLKLATTNTGVDVTGVITTDGMTTSADINFGDGDKAIFGAGSDLQIYHSGSTSYIYEQGTGDLRIRGSQVRIEDDDGSTIALFKEDAGVELRYNGAVKLESTATGADITGVLTADEVTVDNLNLDGNTISSTDTNGNVNIDPDGTGETVIDSSVRITKTSGAPTLLLTDNDTSGDGTIDASDGNLRFYSDNDGEVAGSLMGFYVDGSQAMHINSSGNVGIGTASPSTALDVTGTVTATAFSGDGSALTGIAAGATGGGSDQIFYENGQTVTANYTITNGKNAMSAGPITINSGITVTVGTGETWTVV